MDGSQIPRIGGPLDGINDAFHDDYARVRDASVLADPVLVLLGDTLTLVQAGGATRTFDVTPRVYHALKSLAHLPVAVFAVMQRGGDARRLAALTDASFARLAEDVGEPTCDECRALLEATRAFIRDGGELEAYARAMGPRMLALGDRATREQLAALHARFEDVLACLSADERAHLHVVVAGVHQARARSLGMQYFQRRLDEPEGIERRVTYAEAVDTVEGALALVGTQRLDRRMAHAFFGDENRLQRDILGDSAKRILDEADLDTL
ncbi:MAG TPA: hypothetical protein VG755_08190 [Nannocystaceae bacterium]|nr:hypothetical protein [Nannocystaceae bacterium]